MSDHTPTTREVRKGYAEDPVAEYYDPITNHTAEGERAFDRWYAEEIRKAKAQAWDEAVAAMKYTDGTPVEIAKNINPYTEES